MLSYTAVMPRRPTFDTIAYTPDDGECLTPAQAVALLDHVRPQAEVLARRVADELARRLLSPVEPERPLALFRPTDLVASHGRNSDHDWLCVGTVPYQAAVIGPPLDVALQWWWAGQLRVGWWLVTPPRPEWDR